MTDEFDPEATGHLATAQIDRQIAALRREIKELNVGPVRISGNGESRAARRIVEALIILAVASLIGEAWVIKGTVEVQQNSIQFLQKQVDSVADETRANSHSVDEMKGRFYRGLQEGKDPYAPGK